VELQEEFLTPYTSTPKRESGISSKKSVSINKTIQCHKPEEHDLKNSRFDNFTTYNRFFPNLLKGKEIGVTYVKRKEL
jgi:hypothetical protein